MKTLRCKWMIGLLYLGFLMLTGCAKDDPEKEDDEPSETGSRATGWNMSTEDMSKYPREISFSFVSSGSSTNLPAKVDLRDKLPPIGNQGSYGTCVAWAVGYGHRTYLYGIEKGLNSSQLANTSNQFSPKDLFWAVPSGEKGAQCNGTNFEPAFDILVSRGIATMKTVPYTQLGDCSSTPQSDWTNEAGNYKVKNYRMIDSKDWSANNFKTHLAQGQAVSIGARLGDNFMQWQGSAVLNSETYLQPDMQHAYHALVLIGYDDSKGANGAFLVYNSWGTSWGDNGFIWIDYNFFLNNFIFGAFVVTPENNVTPDNNHEIDPDDLSSGTDLLAYNAYDQPFADYRNYPGCNRVVNFNVYNSGTTTIPSSKKWSVVYMYYNAFNANDYGILTHFYYTNEVNGYCTFPQAGLQLPVGGIGWCINNDIPPGKNIAAVYFNQPKYEYFIQPYYLPNTLNGYYYMVLIADPFNCISEIDKQNNFYFISDAAGYPIPFVNGVPMVSSAKSGESTLKSAVSEQPQHTVVNEKNRNAYSPDEIQQMLIRQRESGELERQVKKFETEKDVAKPKGK